jgi:predicted extracellular nuclease
VPGVVTVVTDGGFWMQDPSPDGDPATSEGIFVASGSARAPGEAVEVTGKVVEELPGGDDANLSITEIDATSVRRTGTGTVKATVVKPPVRRVRRGLRYHESLEGMLVRIPRPQVVGPRSSFGELPVVTRGATPRTGRGGVLYRPHDVNPERLILDDRLAKVPVADVGDRLAGTVRAVVSYSFGNYKYEVTSAPRRIDRHLRRERTPPVGRRRLAVASMNVENLSFVNPASKFRRLARIVARNLRSPDILAVEEMQDDDGAPQEGRAGARKTFRRFIRAIRAAGGPRYRFRQISPQPGADGGEPGGNIRVGFLFRTDRGLRFVARGHGDATTPTREDRHRRGAQLTLSPGRVMPRNPAFRNSRKPLAGQFRIHGHDLFVIAVHLNSKGGDEPLMGRVQPPRRPSETQRHRQARAVGGFVRSLLRADRRARVVVMGDFNDFDFSRTLEIVRSAGLTNLMGTLPLRERYSYVFEGNSQVLDQILVSRSLARAGTSYDSVHVNAEFADQASDHDPQVAQLRP